MSKPKDKPFVPFANEADVLRIGGLQVENRLDRITIAGDIDLTLDQAGLKQAQALHQLLAAVVGKLEEQAALPEKLAAPAVTKVANPFG